MSEPPTLPGWPIVGALRGLRRDYLGTISRADREVGGIARIVAGPPGWRMIIVSVTSPELIEEVLSNPQRFRKNHPGYRELRAALGVSVLTSEDDSWHRQRRLLASVFTRRRVATLYAPVMADEAQRLVERWRPAARRGDPLDAYPEMITMASRVSGRILFGADMSTASDLLVRFRHVNDQLLRRATSPHPVPSSLPTPGNRRLRRGLRQTRAIVDDLITRRRAVTDLAEDDVPAAPSSTGPPPDDMLGLLLSARDAENEADRLTATEVADQAMLFLLAGHDTTSVTLSCTLLELALHPEWQQRLRDEADTALAGRTPTADDLPHLPWTARTVRETLRLFPAAHGMGRSTLGDQRLGGYRIPANTWIELSVWGTHHSARTWPDPERFDPTRFDLAEGQPAGGHRYAYLPFGGGARACIGMPIALTEVSITVATVLQAYVVSTPLRGIPVHAAITLLPTGRLPIVVRPR
ncbi:MAG TPA: cytochrome P450 [Microlunatus sp.]